MFDLIPGLAQTRQVGLSEQATEAAVAALMPVFTAALKKAAENPEDMRALLTMTGAGPWVEAYDRATAAMPAEIKQKSGELLAAVFGTERVQKAIAAHAATQAGLNEAIMAEMVPAMAAMMMTEIARRQAENPLLQAWMMLINGAAEGAGAALAAFPGAAAAEPAVTPVPAGDKTPAPEEPALREQILRDIFAAGRGLQAAQLDGMRGLLDSAGPDRDRR